MHVDFYITCITQHGQQWQFEGWGCEACRCRAVSEKSEFTRCHQVLWEPAITSGSVITLLHAGHRRDAQRRWGVTGGRKTKAGSLLCWSGKGKSKGSLLPQMKKKHMLSPAFLAIDLKCSCWAKIQRAGVPRKSLGCLSCGFWQSDWKMVNPFQNEKLLPKCIKHSQGAIKSLQT